MEPRLQSESRWVIVADKNLIGAAGEHLVLSRLLSRGILASQAPRGARKADILVNPLDGGKPKLIQVKSTSSGSGPVGWKMKDEHMTEKSTDLIYCFVDFRNQPERVYVIPAKKVAQVLVAVDKAWMKKPMKDGSKREKNMWRMIKPKFIVITDVAKPGWMDKYLEKWELLK
jgi:hypothetical protein